MLAADIIHTIHSPVLNELYVLAMIVGIRSVISFFLVKEIENIQQRIVNKYGNGATAITDDRANTEPS